MCLAFSFDLWQKIKQDQMFSYKPNDNIFFFGNESKKSASSLMRTTNVCWFRSICGHKFPSRHCLAESFPSSGRFFLMKSSVWVASLHSSQCVAFTSDMPEAAMERRTRLLFLFLLLSWFYTSCAFDEVNDFWFVFFIHMFLTICTSISISSWPILGKSRTFKSSEGRSCKPGEFLSENLQITSMQTETNGPTIVGCSGEELENRFSHVG